MSTSKPRSQTRKSVLLYQETKDDFDTIHRELGSQNHSQTIQTLIKNYRINNQRVKV